MGCWNQTCGLSHLPIMYRDPVVVYLLVKQQFLKKFRGGICYSNELFYPLMVPIYGTYDEYGRPEAIIGDPSTHLLKWITTRGSMSGKTLQILGEHEAQDPVALEAGLESVISFIQDGNCAFTESKRGTLLELSYVMMHRSIHDRLITAYAKRVPYGQDIDLEGLLSTSTLDALRLYYQDPKSFEDPEKVERSVRAMLSGLLRSDEIANSDLFRFLLSSLSPEELCPMIVHWNLIRYVVSGLRQTWMPQSGYGSQAAEYSLLLELQSGIAEIVDAVRESRGEDEDETWTGEETIFWFS